MDTQPSRHLPLTGTHNIRDLGGYPASAGYTRWRQVLRADSPHRLDAGGIDTLVQAGLRTVIDLRHQEEIDAAPNPFSGHHLVAYYNVSLFEGIQPPRSADGATVDTLLELYKLALAERSGAIRAVLEIIAHAPEGAVLFHCTAGKDRTGVISALLLGLGGVDPATIRDDYALTAKMIAPLVDELLSQAVARGIDPAAYRPLLVANPATMEAFLAHLEQCHGGVVAYLANIGIDADIRERLRRRLVDTVLEGGR